MSDGPTDSLIELAYYHIDYWTGTIWEQILAHDLDTKDYEGLAYHLIESATEMAFDD